VRLLLFVYVSQDCSNACALVLLNFIGVSRFGYGWVVYSWLNDHFRILYGFVNLSGLVKYLLIERYLAAKIGTIYLDLVRWVLCITVIEVVFHFFSAGVHFH
jgi:hypothetical protein